jgi:Tfp pilus assembly PilM family ATPase
MALFFEENPPLGLDISDYKLRLVQLRKNGKKAYLSSFNEVAVPEGVISDGVIQDMEKMSELLHTLKKGMTGARIKTKNRVIVSLPEKQSFIKLAIIEKKDVKSIQAEMEKHLPFSLKDVYYDYQIYNDVFPNADVLHFAAGRKEIIDSYLNVLKETNFHPEVIEVETEAMARCLFLPMDKMAYLGIDIGLARTTFYIVYKKLVVFSISYPSIIHEKTAYIPELEESIKRVFDFYKEHLEKFFPLEAIITCGTGAHITNLHTEIEKKYKIKTLPGNPWQNIKNGHSRLAKKMPYPISYSTAIGLSLRSILYKKYL